MSRQRPSRVSTGRASSSAMVVAPQTDREFSTKLRCLREQTRKLKKGCSFCGLRCLEALRDDDDSILRFREAFRNLPKQVQDRDLLWIFGGGPAQDQSLSTHLEGSTATQYEQTSPTASSEPAEAAGPMESTSSSSPGSASESPNELEVTSASGSESVEQPMQAPSDPDQEAVLEVTSSSSEFAALVPDEIVPAPLTPPKKRRRYSCHKRTGSCEATVPVEGILTDKPLLICRKLAFMLMGVGPGRVQRILDGLGDGRTRGMRLPNDGTSRTSGPMSVCLRFLWRKYHFDAEGLPDKFSVHRHDSDSFTIGVQGALHRIPVAPNSASPSHGLDKDEVQEEEERAIAGMSLYISSAHEPSAMVNLGPGVHGGPARYIGVMKPIHLYLELEAWCAMQDIPKPSFNTLLRALDQSGCVRFRKTAGQHPNCDTCMHYKQRLRAPQSPRQRAAVLEDYCKHILLQWFDRGVDANSTELSRLCRRMIDLGTLLINMARQSSFWFMRADGVDQAKFRVPRCATKTHAFDKLIRPALHVQGAWCEGFGFHFAVADGDMKKDTNNNIEVIARLIESLYRRYDALPLAIAIVQDNTSRECKNQRLVKFAIKLIALNCLESVALLYPEKGHTHSPLDGVFGQMCVKLSLEEFDDDMDVVTILDDFLKASGLDAGTRQDAKAYKLDEAAEWVLWAEESVDLVMSALTGPEAPHYFRICRRKHIGTDAAHGDKVAEQAACHRADHRDYQPNGDDVVMIVKDRMASTEVSQIILMVPAADLGRIHGSPLQPMGIHPRRPASDSDRKKVFDAATAVFHENAISQKAHDYLTQWSRGTRRRRPRLSHFQFLTHRAERWHAPRAAASYSPASGSNPRPVVVAAMGGGHNLSLGEESDDDHEPGPLVIA